MKFYLYPGINLENQAMLSKLTYSVDPLLTVSTMSETASTIHILCLLLKLPITWTILRYGRLECAYDDVTQSGFKSNSIQKSDLKFINNFINKMKLEVSTIQCYHGVIKLHHITLFTWCLHAWLAHHT